VTDFALTSIAIAYGTFHDMQSLAPGTDPWFRYYDAFHVVGVAQSVCAFSPFRA
jgi:hypothetical protein